MLTHINAHSPMPGTHAHLDAHAPHICTRIQTRICIHTYTYTHIICIYYTRAYYASIRTCKCDTHTRTPTYTPTYTHTRPTLATALQVIKSGPEGGVTIEPNSMVEVQYTGQRIDGVTFGSSYNDGQPLRVMPKQVCAEME